MKKIQVPVVGGLRKTVTVLESGDEGTTIQGLAGQTVTLAQLAAAVAPYVTTSSSSSTAGGNIGGGNGNSIALGPGLSGGGALVGAVPINLIAPIPAWIFEDGDDGGGVSAPGTPGTNGINGVGSPGPAGPAIYLNAEDGEDGMWAIPGKAGANGINGVGSPGPAGAPVWPMVEDGEDGMWGPPGAAGAAGTGGTTTLVPATIPDLMWWWQGDIANISSGTTMQRMFDSGPWTGNHCAPVTGVGVVRSATQLNGKNVFTWPGASTGRFALNSGILLPTVTIFAVVNPALTATGKSVININGPTGAFQYTQDGSNGKMAVVKSNTAVVGESTSALTDGTWYQVNAAYNASTGAYAFRKARAADGSGTNAQSITSNTTTINYNPNNNSEDTAGSIAELIIYQRVLTLTEIQTVEAYLLAKWGV